MSLLPLTRHCDFEPPAPTDATMLEQALLHSGHVLNGGI